MSEFVEQPLTGVPRTMPLTARSRVDEHQQPNGLFKDPIVAKWWKSLTWDSTLDPMSKSPAPFTWANRAYIIDSLVAKHLQKHRDAVVVELETRIESLT